MHTKRCSACLEKVSLRELGCVRNYLAMALVHRCLASRCVRGLPNIVRGATVHLRGLRNRAITLKSRPGANEAVTLDNFTLSAGESLNNDVVARTLYLSVDPYMRCRFNADTGVDYVRPFEIGSPITSAAVSAT